MLLYACTAAIVGTDTTSGEGGAGTQEERTEDVAVGEVGTVGQWEVTVESVETTDTFDDGGTEQVPQGEFLVVTMTVLNSGDEATIFDESGVTVVDSDGNTHMASGQTGEQSLFLEQINPGNSVTGEVVFDVPEGTDATTLQVEDVISLEDTLKVRLD
ncbi:DUF4352 domain-containing protein [Nocardiopsis sp. MG754419]|uniref:DUF4352 domain-containing protein n=1 Tax=Nocardiopsis sp. MG754419 TaxID=2259865 RepID=UPI0027DC2936|nr:DUF4352 domain-containing protein [Nocardiopsis sp. MG754419]